MDLITQFIDLFLHLDDHIEEVIRNYGGWTHAILFVIIFCETGLVVVPFLPGDSLLFVAGTFAARGSLNLPGLLLLLSTAAILGDAVNYAIGFWIGPSLNREKDGRFIKKKYLDKTHAFYEKYGKMTIILARFVPIVRTFAPFMAGVGSMRYSAFAAYNVIGGILWVVSMTMAGYFFGNIEWVKEHFEAVVLAIIFISILPIIVEYLKSRRTSTPPP